MRIASLALMGLIAGFVLAAPVTAQSRIETLSGSVYEGKIVSDDGAAVEIETTDGSTLKLPYAQLTPMTVYRLRRDKAGSDARARLELAEWCVDQTLYLEARREYRAALAADAALADEINASLVKARTQAADELLARAKGLLAAGKTKDARSILGAIVQELPLEEAATEAAGLLAADTEQRKAASLTPDEAPASAAAADGAAVGARAKRTTAADFSEATRKTMGPVVDAYKKLLDRTQAGLESSKQGTSIKEFEKALDQGDKAVKAVDKLRPGTATDEELADAINIADVKLEEAIVECRIFLVDAYLIRTSYKQANDVVKQGLAVYPKNERLRRASERVTAAASNNDGGWVIGGGRPNIGGGRPR